MPEGKAKADSCAGHSGIKVASERGFGGAATGVARRLGWLPSAAKATHDNGIVLLRTPPKCHSNMTQPPIRGRAGGHSDHCCRRLSKAWTARRRFTRSPAIRYDLVPASIILVAVSEVPLRSYAELDEPDCE